MARSVPKCKRAAYVYDRDFIVVDDISGVLKMRSECAIDGYGFLSSQGDIRNPQETPPIIREQMAAWPDPRPIGQPVFTPSPDYQYFLFNYFIVSVQSRATTFDATASVGLNAPIASMEWSVDGVYVVSGLVPVVTMSGGVHTISVLITDDYGNQQTFSFEYASNSTTPVTVLDLQFTGANGSTTFTDSSTYGATFTRTGSPTIQDNMGEFTSDGYYIRAPQPVAGLWEWGANDFEITGEFMLLDSVGGYRVIISQRNLQGTAGAFAIGADSAFSNKLLFFIITSGGEKLVLHQTTPTANTLHTFKAARHGAYLRLWLNDVESTTPVYIGSDTISHDVTDITVGVSITPSTYYTLGGRVDNLKIVKFIPV